MSLLTFFLISCEIIWYSCCVFVQGEVQYFIGVQLDGSEHVEPLHNCIPEPTAKEGAKMVRNCGCSTLEGITT